MAAVVASGLPSKRCRLSAPSARLRLMMSSQLGDSSPTVVVVDDDADDADAPNTEDCAAAAALALVAIVEGGGRGRGGDRLSSNRT